MFLVQISQQKSQLQTLELQVSSVSSTDAALVDAQSQTLSLKAELEKLQGINVGYFIIVILNILILVL